MAPLAMSNLRGSDSALSRSALSRYLALSAMPFVHLHTHSEYSLLDGANRIPDLISRVKELGMDSLALTDHGNLFGAWTFHEQARAHAAATLTLVLHIGKPRRSRDS